MIGKNLELIRKFVGISQRELGRRIEMSGQYIAKIEKGERTPTVNTIEKIASALNVEVYELFEHPKFTRELFFEKIEKQNITEEEILKNCDFPIGNLSRIFSDRGLWAYIHGYYEIGMYLGFSKDFLKKRYELDLEIKKTIPTHLYDKHIEDLKNKYRAWVNHRDKYNRAYLMELAYNENPLDEKIAHLYDKMKNHSLTTDDIKLIDTCISEYILKKSNTYDGAILNSDKNDYHLFLQFLISLGYTKEKLEKYDTAFYLLAENMDKENTPKYSEYLFYKIKAQIELEIKQLKELDSKDTKYLLD
ncbi:helix-turn-helix transcriptional regulator [Clostridium sp. 19966]|uniref:helix-turn-helix domain-containing protein n=1 Tax=Clostridium sp. 19966 TaxID=2768166 RepID=UPI0028DEE8F0|nr:helix-turn-helix transcriptional regulator [Clostridium sp. 19966]MDT8715559.1 helix-turn-helix transcriptional regulator [Clostridium sp. 19966]